MSREICRICGAMTPAYDGERRKDLLDDQILNERVDRYLHIDVYSGDERPHNICVQCEMEVNRTADFVERAKRVQRLLHVGGRPPRLVTPPLSVATYRPPLSPLVISLDEDDDDTRPSTQEPTALQLEMEVGEETPEEKFEIKLEKLVVDESREEEEKPEEKTKKERVHPVPSPFEIPGTSSASQSHYANIAYPNPQSSGVAAFSWTSGEEMVHPVPSEVLLPGTSASQLHYANIAYPNPQSSGVAAFSRTSGREGVHQVPSEVLLPGTSSASQSHYANIAYPNPQSSGVAAFSWTSGGEMVHPVPSEVLLPGTSSASQSHYPNIAYPNPQSSGRSPHTISHLNEDNDGTRSSIPTQEPINLKTKTKRKRKRKNDSK